MSKITNNQKDKSSRHSQKSLAPENKMNFIRILQILADHSNSQKF